ncbi:MAG: cytochrome o ubiquinol oxidase subunit IV [Paracoccus denitrificans]|uniref:Cytochrome bo(3) ubiquinol oxidase subunit 4 n=1 Tax=Paracoccus denitrificans TaxID=266 RepID=A0A533I943_PARDE|nr:MAG: cytochrome o ubiquinol oxidase subunit IV [Paracoccus denitrificans]
MSSTEHHGGNGHHHDEGHAAQFPHGTKRDYVTGFVLSVILTVIPFGLVMSGGFASARMTAFVVLGCAVVQMVVHMVYFLHMTPRQEGGWTLISMVFTLIVLVIAVAGTLWVMYHMDTNMMPGMMAPAGDTGQITP